MYNDTEFNFHLFKYKPLITYTMRNHNDIKEVLIWDF